MIGKGNKPFLKKNYSICSYKKTQTLIHTFCYVLTKNMSLLDKQREKTIGEKKKHFFVPT